ncbi:MULTISPECIES: alpha/beta fold hydrolase [unclassified Streptomyces]|uniref:thioesterase II family protein n=1 Tax=unclassified Streptomyces TaxID=2593676 RepID=UPI0029ACB275|nr:alpha/beta fold hydrolase [Streptomyces sp. DK15]MDX2393803.1 alpha/beta fold hydrolase [Streptomyces sp. DK15]
MSGPLIRPLPRPRARLTLFCLSFCGGGTAPFRSWARTLPEDVELVLYCYPGREGRFTDPFARDWEELLDGALGAVRSLGGRPYVLLGHSMGAWVAFDLAVRAERSGGTGPRALVASAAHAPTRVRETLATPPSLYGTDEELLDWMGSAGQLADAVRAEPELARMAVDVFRADLRVLDGYHHRPGTRVRAPLQLLYGERDTVDATDAEAWRRLTAGGFTATPLPGGHFYTPEVWQRLPDHVPALRPAGPVGAGAPGTADVRATDVQAAGASLSTRSRMARSMDLRVAPLPNLMNSQ